MAATFDAKATTVTVQGAPSTPITNSTLTTGGTASIVFGVFSAVTDTTLAVATSMTWNGVTMTLVGSKIASDSKSSVYVYAIVNPATGNQTLSCAFTNGTGSQQVDLDCFSFKGSATASVAAAIPSANIISDASTPAGTVYPASAMTVTTVNGDAAIAVANSVSTNLNGVNVGTLINTEASSLVNYVSIYNLAVSSSTQVQFTDGGINGFPAEALAFDLAQPATATVQLRAPFLSKLFSWPCAPAFQPYNLALYTVAVAQAPFVQMDWSKPFVPLQLPQQPSVYNINLFTNPIPFGPYDYGEGPSRISPFRPDATQPLNPNLFTNPIPFGPFDWNKAVGLPPERPVPVRGLNINLFTNPIPFAKFDWFPVNPPPASPPQALPYNINIFTNPIPFAQFMWTDTFGIAPPPPQAVPYNVNIFTNPIPFAQFDWSHPFVPTSYFPAPTQALNLQLFTNPIPFFNLILQPSTASPFFTPSMPYNVPLYTVTVTAAPFAQYDWPLVKRPRPQQDATQAFNPNIFTNPIPIIPIDYSAITPRLLRAPDQAYYNLNVYSVVVTAAPFIPIDYSKPFFPRALLPDASQSTSINLLPDPTLFMQVGWFGSGSVPRFNLPDQQAYNQSLYGGVVVQSPFVVIDWSKPFFPRVLPPDPPPVNIQLFTNPIPFFNLDLKGVSKPAGTPDLSVPYNVNLYGVVVVAPFAQYDWSKPFPPLPAPAQAQPYNPNIFTNPIPFAQFYWPTQFNVPQAQLNRSVQTNINLFTNPIPFVQNQYPGQRSVKLTPIPILPYNPNIYTVTVAGTTLHVVKFIGNMGHFMIR